MKNNNRGFTLVELLVVVIIMGIVAGVVGLSLSTAHAAKNKRAATELNSLITMCRTSSISREGDVFMKVSLNNKGKISVDYFEGSGGKLAGTTVIGNSTTPLSYIKNNSTETLDFRSSNTGTMGFYLAFDRTTGAQKQRAPDNYYITSIIIGSNTITLVPSTGSHSLA